MTKHSKAPHPPTSDISSSLTLLPCPTTRPSRRRERSVSFRGTTESDGTRPRYSDPVPSCYIITLNAPKYFPGERGGRTPNLIFQTSGEGEEGNRVSFLPSVPPFPLPWLLFLHENGSRNGHCYSYSSPREVKTNRSVMSRPLKPLKSSFLPDVLHVPSSVPSPPSPPGRTTRTLLRPVPSFSRPPTLDRNSPVSCVFPLPSLSLRSHKKLEM